MQASPFSYQFTPLPGSSSTRLHHETLPLQVLCYLNKGQMPRSDDGIVGFRCAVIGKDYTLAEIAGDKSHYVPEQAIHGNHFVLHMSECRHNIITFIANYYINVSFLPVVRTYPLTATASLRENKPVITHTCISRKIYGLFASDAVVNSLSDNESAWSSDDDDIEPAPTRPSQRQRSTQQPITRSSATSSNRSLPAAPLSLVPLSTSSSATAFIPSPLQRNPSLSTISSLPSQIWKEKWTPSNGRYEGLFMLPAAIADSVYDVATSDTNYEELEVRGVDVADLAAQLKTKIKRAVERRDFTELLVPEREFYM